MQEVALSDLSGNMSVQLRLGDEGISALRDARNLDWSEADLLEVTLSCARAPGDAGLWLVRCGLRRLGNDAMLALRLDDVEIKYSDLPSSG